MSPVSRQRGFMGSEMMSSPVSTLDVYGGRSPRTPVEEEDKAIAEKGFYLHPSSLSTPRGNEPELLVLFPLSSPKTDSSSMSF
ncbi:VQ-like protein [Artemisia annua]|nr:VQ-like protein [Artemisia annua]